MNLSRPGNEYLSFPSQLRLLDERLGKLAVAGGRQTTSLIYRLYYATAYRLFFNPSLPPIRLSMRTVFFCVG